MKISVIIPTYKPRAYINQCFDALAAQTLSHSEYEVLVVLNGCGDPYLSQLQAYQKAHRELCMRILHTDEAGVSGARNIGLNHAQGDFVCFIDDDDWVSPRYLDKLLTRHCDYGIVVANVMGWHEDSKSFAPDYLGEAYEKIKSSRHASLFQARSLLSSSCCKLIPHSIIGDTRFSTHLEIGEDTLFMTEISRHIHQIDAADTDCVYYRRIRGDSASNRIRPLFTARNAQIQLRAYLQLLVRHPLGYNYPFISTRIVSAVATYAKARLIDCRF